MVEMPPCASRAPEGKSTAGTVEFLSTRNYNYYFLEVYALAIRASRHRKFPASTL